MSKNHQMLFAAVLACATAGVSAQPFTHVKTVNGMPARMTHATTDGNGGVYFAASSDDKVYFVPDLLDDAETSYTVFEGGFGSGNSHGGATWDGAKLYTGGKTNDTSSIFYKAVPAGGNPPTWTTNQGTPYSLSAVLSGPAAVGTNKIVVAQMSDGGLIFYTDNGSNLTADNGTPISGGAPNSKSVAYDPVRGKIYVAAAGSNQTGGIQVFNSDGTAAGTLAGSQYIASVSTTLGDAEQGIRYQSIAIHPTNGLLAFSRNTGAAGTTGWVIWNLNTNTQLQFIDLSDTPGGQLSGVAGTTGQNQAQGVTFFEKNGQVYLAVATGSNAAARRIEIYQGPASNVADWSLY